MKIGKATLAMRRIPDGIHYGLGFRLPWLFQAHLVSRLALPIRRGMAR